MSSMHKVNYGVALSVVTRGLLPLLLPRVAQIMGGLPTMQRLLCKVYYRSIYSRHQSQLPVSV